MELRQLASFVAVSESASFSRAAEQLFISQSAISHQIARLEADLDVPLFDRTTRSVALTEAGHRLLPVAQQILESVERAYTIVRMRSSRIRLAANMSFADRALSAIAAVRERGNDSAESMDVEIEFVIKSFAARVDAVRSGDVDIALIRGRIGDAQLDVHPLWVEDLVIATSTRHPLAGRESVPLAELASYPLLLPPRRQQVLLHDVVDEAFGLAGVSPTYGPPIAADHTAALELVNQPRAWTVLYDEATALAIAKLRETQGRLRVPVSAITRASGARTQSDRTWSDRSELIDAVIDELRR